tara:strand:+ start:96 stop:464 length:369 start_codon:yes stop_codon:yes gene_type:complete
VQSVLDRRQPLCLVRAFESHPAAPCAPLHALPFYRLSHGPTHRAPAPAPLDLGLGLGLGLGFARSPFWQLNSNPMQLKLKQQPRHRRRLPALVCLRASLLSMRMRSTGGGAQHLLWRCCCPK